MDLQFNLVLTSAAIGSEKVDPESRACLSEETFSRADSVMTNLDHEACSGTCECTEFGHRSINLWHNVLFNLLSHPGWAPASNAFIKTSFNLFFPLPVLE